MQAKHLAILVLLASIWGGSFLFTRIAVHEFGALPLTALRSLLAALSLLPVLCLRGQWPAFRRHWPHLLVVGLISTAIPFCLISLTTQYTSAGFASILNSLTPLFSTLFAWLWLRESLSVAAVLGILLGFGGVVVMMNDGGSIAAELPLLPVLCGLGAALFYGLTANWSRRFLTGVPAIVIAFGSQCFATLFLVPAAALVWPAAVPGPAAWASGVVLGVVCTGLAFLLFFNLVAQVGVARSVVVTYLVPVFAMSWGWLFLGEQLTPHMLAGAACILTGITLSTGMQVHFRRLLRS